MNKQNNLRDATLAIDITSLERTTKLHTADLGPEVFQSLYRNYYADREEKQGAYNFILIHTDMLVFVRCSSKFCCLGTCIHIGPDYIHIASFVNR